MSVKRIFLALALLSAAVAVRPETAFNKIGTREKLTQIGAF